ncbi:NF038122 family metalloprotease [Scytonema sp. UIC 10036]|uniref:NF038122 family metalloprotease n=1 Tax=Scytonema sp. UIC 10036 TaxID=2304196 RepID=UPI001FAA3D4E|nr:NF038122 family metalloprotease [Scytonema sp. UIC 10036]
MIATEVAAQLWSELLADDVTIKLFVTTTNHMPRGVLGSATVEKLVSETPYQNFLSKLSAGKKSLNDKIAYKNLQKGNNGEASELSVMVNERVLSGIDDIQLARANAKALELLPSNDLNFDGHIVLNKLSNSSSGIPLTWSYNLTSNQIPSDTLDFLSMAVHEIGHTLGFISGVDNPNLQLAIKNDKTRGIPIEESVVEDSITPLDLYRFSNQSKDKIVLGDNYSLITMGIPDLSPGKVAFTTFDLGLSKVEYMSTGDTTLGGDGNQASHWNQDKNAVMEPYLRTGQREAIASADLIAFDLIGWDVRSEAKSLNQLGAILPSLYERAKATAEYKLANSSTWILIDPPLLVNPITLDVNNTQNNNVDDSDDVDDLTPLSAYSQDSALAEVCNNSQNNNTSHCILWRTSGFGKWREYYGQLGLR